ncbi:TolC family protein [Seonamhaeicola sp. MEBiC1930]|uniref:TolC family protein n=1 Tax=Seonamhaeicola sp. MEBiC01930 TaxID=2976768 RepID=UPI00324A3E6E
MKLLLRFIIILVFNCTSYLHAQDEMLEVSTSRTKSITSLPPLEVVTDSVLKRSGMLNYRNSSIKRLGTLKKSKRIDITRHIGLSGDTRYGNFNNFSTNEDGQVISALATTSKVFNYSVGVYLRLPLYDVLNRKKLIKTAELEVEEAINLAEAEEQTIRQNVIRLYQDIALKERLLEIKARAYGDGNVNMQMVEKEFRNGIVPVAEYVRITSITSNLQIEYEKAKSEFVLAKQLLEDLAGYKFDILTGN